jgi:hypothetical protein
MRCRGSAAQTVKSWPQAKDFAIALGCALVRARLIIGASVATYACVLSAAVDSRRQHLDEGGPDRKSARYLRRSTLGGFGQGLQADF